MKGWVWVMVVFGISQTACGASTRSEQTPHSPGLATVAVSDGDAWRKEKPGPGVPANVRFPPPAVWTLPNGLTLYVISRPASIVRLRVVSLHGQSSAPEGKSGIAALTARMLTEGTRSHSGHQLAEAAESLGSTLDAWAERDSASIELATFPDRLQEALDLLGEVVTQPLFDARDFERVKGEWLDNLRSERQDPERLASIVGLRVLNGQQHGAPVNGSLSSVSQLSLQDLRAYHAAAFAPSESALFMVGGITMEAAQAMLSRAFTSWRDVGTASVRPAPPLPKPASKRRVVLIHRPGAVQTAMFLGQRFPKRSEPGYELRQVMGNAVGGLFTSRINRNLREKNGYTYGAFGRPIATRHWGAFVVTTSVRSDATAPALKEVLKELTHVREPAHGLPLASDEVARAKAALIHSIGATLEHSTRVLGAVSELFVQRLPSSYFSHYPAAITSISLAEVQQSAGGLAPERVSVVLVGDEKTVRPALEHAGFSVQLGAEALAD